MPEALSSIDPLRFRKHAAHGLAVEAERALVRHVHREHERSRGRVLALLRRVRVRARPRARVRVR
tara:strand:- start:797 stop:991 length:195 start_codon:yes stop_codon:yes gene_type:complete|eukprot:scaffold17055_cov54-Phaeocystis_antarctica.AAC.2